MAQIGKKHHIFIEDSVLIGFLIIGVQHHLPIGFGTALVCNKILKARISNLWYLWFDSRNLLPSTALDPNKNKIFEYMKFIKNRKNVHLISMNDMVKLLKDYHDTE